jgi:nucleotide-binding universal stress UspA family protein
MGGLEFLAVIISFLIGYGSERRWFDPDQYVPVGTADDWAQRKGGRMYKHILIPTDGSELSEKAIEAGIAFARFIHARVTGFTAVPEYSPPSEADLISRHAISISDYERDARKQAEATLQSIADRARAAGIDYDAEFAQSDRPYEAIIHAAEQHGCDLIFMASHGRRGLSAMVHGSETQGVLTHSTIPALVYR